MVDCWLIVDCWVLVFGCRLLLGWLAVCLLDVDYWWLIFWMSGIVDPFSGPKIGDIVLIADLNSLNSLFS